MALHAVSAAVQAGARRPYRLRRERVAMIWLQVAAGLIVGYVTGAVPFSYLIGRRFCGVDLRTEGSGSTAPSNLYRVCGLTPAVAGGALEVSKGFVGPLIAPHAIPLAVAGAGGLAAFAHTYPPFLRGGGGRGLSTATGALTVLAWPAGLVMLSGLVIGALVRRVYPAMSLALIALVPTMWLLRGPYTALGAGIVVVPVGWKTAAMLRRRRAATPAPSGHAPDDTLGSATVVDGG